MVVTVTAIFESYDEGTLPFQQNVMPIMAINGFEPGMYFELLNAKLTVLDPPTHPVTLRNVSLDPPTHPSVT